MRKDISSVATAFAIVCLAGLVLTTANHDAFAQAKKAPAKQAEPAPASEPPLKQIALTDKQIESVLAAQKELDAITDKLPENAQARPDPKIVAQLDDVAKKNGFASYGEYNDVVENISLVLSGFDPKTKKYVGPEAVIRQQIAAVQADKKIAAKDKKEALADLNGAFKTPPPPIENKSNIDLVEKYYDRLAAMMQDE
jgi:hypothetical protein